VGHLAQAVRDAVFHWIQSVTLREHKSLGVIEFQIEFSSDHLRYQCAANQRAAHRRSLVPRKPIGHFNGESPNIARPQKQSIKVEPQVSVMAGFEFEMSFSGMQQL
jgi:hypothetical protein